MFKDVLELGELYVAIRILRVAGTAMLIGCALIFPHWFLVDVAVVLMWAFIACIPLAVIWAIAVVISAFLRFRT
jgi:hypothetical protein